MIYSTAVAIGRVRHKYSEFTDRPSLYHLASYLFWSLFLVIASASVSAHARFDVHIDRLTSEILKNPNDAGLYVERAELFRRHMSWDMALADYKDAQRLGADIDAINLGLGHLYQQQGQHERAIGYLSNYLEKNPGNIGARVLRAKTYGITGKHILAAQDYTYAIQLTTGDAKPHPEYFYARAQELIAAGCGHEEKALMGLDEGIARLGPVASLETLAIEIEINLRKYANALERISAVLNRVDRKEQWLVRQGEVLRLACRWGEAEESYRLAESAINKLPASKRNTPYIRMLEVRINKAADVMMPREHNMDLETAVYQ